MLSTGQGLTFTDDDVSKARVIVGLLSRVESFKGLNSAAVVEAAAAFVWLEDMVQKIKDNVFDISTARMVQPADTSAKGD